MKRIGLILAAVVLAACSETWEGYVYPNRNNLSNHVAVGTHQSLDECRAAAINTLNRVSSVSRGDYECGLNCKSNGSLRVCKRTER